jgi:hypothetical protein
MTMKSKITTVASCLALTLLSAPLAYGWGLGDSYADPNYLRRHSYEAQQEQYQRQQQLNEQARQLQEQQRYHQEQRYQQQMLDEMRRMNNRQQGGGW